jgi:RND family efflux transporter MFP subunit
MSPRTRLVHRFPLALLGLAVALPAAALIATQLAGRSAESQTPASSPAVGVAVLAVEPADGYALRRVYTGRVEARRTSALGFERGGRLTEVLVREGEAVAAGQVLARLDRALLDAQRRELEAAQASAQADLALAQATLQRFRESVDQGAVTRQALDEAREGAGAARAAADLAQARIASVDLEIEKAELRAPFDAVVTRLPVHEGQVLAAGSPVVTVQELALPEIRVGVAGPLAETLAPGSEHPLTWRGRTFSARLRALVPLRSGATRTRDALFEPIDPPPGLHPGELVELPLTQWITAPGFWLPLSALAEGNRGLWTAYAVEPLDGAAPAGLIADHRLSPRPVEILSLDGDRVYVRGALAAGERLVAAGLHRVVPGQLVRLLGDPAEALALEGR